MGGTKAGYLESNGAWSSGTAVWNSVDQGSTYITLGNDADIMIFNEDKPWKINPDEFHSKSKNTPFDGMLVEGKNLMTFVRGRLVYKNL